MNVNHRRNARAVEVDGVATGGHYSPAMVAGGFVFVAGQTPRDAQRRIVGQTIEEQTTAVLDNLSKVLAAAGANLDDVVKVTVYLADLGSFEKFNSVFAKYFSEFKPARTTVECGLPGIMVEIDAIAYVGNSS
ncbi:endoribonuclease L-PSP [Trinickia symbiotica]|uniref:RidA family protein n=1 Tax=Trinickia symbiotica TaxID=863227 RepID=A0A2N7WQB6_9BURK|nr:RidA family protein [Trinickia symbiotica]PMS31627.1 RidA family protein [Trinickia symbiotica]PPK41255.1 endoribonuclease L-PSP [Trinickia symbiotica]